MTEEDLIALRHKLETNEREIKALRDWRHEMAQKPQADMLKASLLEQSMLILKEKMSENTAMTAKVLDALNGDETRPGIRGRLQHLEDLMSTTNRLAEAIDGTLQTPGHSQRLNQLDQTVSLYVRVTWLIGGAVITGIIGAAIAFITKHI